MNLHIDFGKIASPPPPPPVPGPTPMWTVKVPATGRFMRLVDDKDTAKWGYVARSRAIGYKSDPDWNGLPATIPMQKRFHVLNEPWQLRYIELYHEVCFKSLPQADVIEAWRHTMKDSGGLCDQHTFDWVAKRGLPAKLFTCHIQKLNLGSEYGDMQQQDLVFSGNIVKVIGEGAGSAALRIFARLLPRAHELSGLTGGEPYYTIETLNTKLPTPSVSELMEKPWLWGMLTSSGYNWETGESRRMQWPWMKNFGVPYLVLGVDGSNRIPKFWCKEVKNNEIVQLYRLGD